MSDSSLSCAVPGNADMYGLGIRLGFYLQWFTSIAANFLMLKAEIASTRFAIYSYLTAVFTALTIQTARGAVTDLDRYIVLLLCFGSYYSQVVIFLWRAVTCFKKELDPTRWTALAAKLPLRVYSQVVLVAIVVSQFVFWLTLPSGQVGSSSVCRRYGFLFGPVSLYGVALKVVNLSLSSFLVCISVVGWVEWWCSRKSKKGFLEPTKVQSGKRERTLVRLRSLVNLLVSITVIAGTELTLSWNQVRDVYALDSLGQLVSFILGLVVLFRVIWVKAGSDASKPGCSSGGSILYYTDCMAPGNAPMCYSSH